jgi:hypothetical protein
MNAEYARLIFRHLILHNVFFVIVFHYLYFIYFEVCFHEYLIF